MPISLKDYLSNQIIIFVYNEQKSAQSIAIYNIVKNHTLIQLKVKSHEQEHSI